MSDSELTAIIVDDQPFVRDRIRALLEAQAAPAINVIGEAANAVDAMQLVRAHAPDLITLDIEMPDGGGMPLLDMVRDEPKKPRIIVVTHSRSEEIVMSALAGGASTILKKDDLTEQTIGTAIAEALAAAGSNQTGGNAKSDLDEPAP